MHGQKNIILYIYIYYYERSFKKIYVTIACNFACLAVDMCKDYSNSEKLLGRYHIRKHRTYLLLIPQRI